MTLEVHRFERLPYGEAFELQMELLEKRRRHEIPDQLLLLEHDSVFTVGRRGQPASLPSSTPVIDVARGGDVTWHGPGQLVGYWIRALQGQERDLHAHLRTIESVLMEVLQDLGLTGSRDSGRTGVFCGGKKLASIGVGVRHWVTCHGFALNRKVDLKIYDSFRPCGYEGSLMTDLASLMKREPEQSELADLVGRRFQKLYGIDS